MGDIENGSIIRFRYKDTDLQGVVISHSPSKFNVKLLNGYNLTIPAGELKLEEILSRVEEKKIEEPGRPRAAPGKRKVALIGTGGTIASRVDYITGAVKPVMDPGFLEERVSNISQFSLDLNFLEAVLSENFTPKNWIEIAQNVEKGLERNGGVIVLHGTDTMSYTASALSFMFENTVGPIVFVGSQRSPDRPSSDAFLNLEAGLEFASTAIGEVGVAMHEGISDDSVVLHRAVRTRKMHSSRRDAFESIGIRPLATYSEGKISISDHARNRDSETILTTKLEEKVALVYFHPALSTEDFNSMTDGKRATVIMGTGLGHTSSRFYPVIEEIVSRGDHVLMTTQCLHGTVDLNVYSTGRELLALGVQPTANMLPEVAMIKAMYVLGNYDDDMFRMYMEANLRGEIAERDTINGES